MASKRASLRDIQRVLAGEAPYDDLGEREQAVVRANWAEQTDDLVEHLDLEAEFTKAGRPWTEADENGQAVSRGAVSPGAVSSAPGTPA